MKRDQARHFLAMLVVVAMASMTGTMYSQEGRLAPLSKTLVVGEVSLIRGSSGWVISPWFSVTRGGSPVTGLDVSLEGRRLRETMPGQYAGIRITDITPVEGGSLSFLIKARTLPALHPVIGKPAGISGSAVIGSLAQITQPVSGTSFTLASIGTALVVAWSGGMPSFDLGVTKPSGSAALSIFSQKGLPGTSFSLPATLFLPGITYSIVLSYKMAPFVLKLLNPDASLLVDKASAVALRCAVISEFTIL
jgi:hypothetical protein